MRTPPCPPPERPDSKDGPVPGDYHIEDAIGIRVLQRVAVRVDRQVDLREILTVSLALEDELPLLEPHANAFPGDAGHLRGQENRGFGQDDIDERIAGADLLALEGGPRSLGTGFARSRRESVDERLAEDAALPLERVLDAHWGILPSLIRTAFAKGAVPSLVNPVELMVYRFHIVFARTGFSIGSRGPDRATRVKGTALSPGRPAVSPARPVSRPRPTSTSRGSEAARCAGSCVRLRPSRSARRASGTAGRPRTPSVRSPGSQARIGACSWPRRVCSLRGRGCPPSTPGGPRGDASRSPRPGLPGSLAPRIGR